MALSEEIKEKIEEKIKPFLPNCPLCGQKGWSVSDNIYAYPIIEMEKKVLLFEKAFPAILIDCNYCHYVLSFHAKKTGIID